MDHIDVPTNHLQQALAWPSSSCCHSLSSCWSHDDARRCKNSKWRMRRLHLYLLNTSSCSIQAHLRLATVSFYLPRLRYFHLSLPSFVQSPFPLPWALSTPFRSCSPSTIVRSPPPPLILPSRFSFAVDAQRTRTSQRVDESGRAPAQRGRSEPFGKKKRTGGERPESARTPRETPHSPSPSTPRYESVLPGLLGRSPGRSALHVVSPGPDAAQARPGRAPRVPHAAVHGPAHSRKPPWRQYAPAARRRRPWIPWIYAARRPTAAPSPAAYFFVGWPVGLCSIAAPSAAWVDSAPPSRPPLSRWPWKALSERRHGRRSLGWHVVWR